MQDDIIFICMCKYYDQDYFGKIVKLIRAWKIIFCQLCSYFVWYIETVELWIIKKYLINLNRIYKSQL